jgi:DNA polymerase
MIRAEKAAYKIVLTVHDEVVSEVPKGWGSQEEFDGLMAQPPLWLPDMPIAVEGWRGPRYHK